MAEVEQAGVQLAGHSRLEQIRAEMNGGRPAGEVESKGQSAIEGSTASGSATSPQADPDAVARRMRELRGE